MLITLDNPDPKVGLLGPRQRAAHALRLDRIRSLPEPRRVGDPNRKAGQHQAHFDHVARGARDIAHDRRLALGQRVQQARLAGVGRADNSDAEAVADALAAVRVVQVAGHVLGQHLQDRAGAARELAWQVFVREIDLGLDQSRRLDQAAPPALIDGAQSAAALAERLATLALGLGVHEVR